MQGGELPLPTNAKENAELAKIVAAQKLAGSKLGGQMYYNLAAFWLRTDDVDNEGTFVDSRTKVKIGFTKWNPGNPNNWKNPAYGYKIDQDFVVMYANGEWNDMDTKDKAHTVCQKKITTTTTTTTSSTITKTTATTTTK